MIWRSPRLRASCRQLPCQMCGREDGTVVAAHCNQGKGMAIKASDAAVMALCFECHTAHDRGGDLPKAERRQLEYELNAKTLRALLERGLVKP